ncbi:MAG: DUF1697 domain-containing protein [Bacteroidales bacterium]
MKKWISFLRGINVGGHAKLGMADLRNIFETLGMKDVQTYIQSGNVLFTAGTAKTGKALSLEIEKALVKKMGIEIAVITLGAEEVKQLLDENPLLKEPGTNADHIHLALFQSAPDPVKTLFPDPAWYAPDRFILHRNAAYVHCPNGYGKTKLTNVFFEKKTGMPATSRSLRTMYKIAELM